MKIRALCRYRPGFHALRPVLLMDMVSSTCFSNPCNLRGMGNVGPMAPLSFMRWATNKASPSSKFFWEELKSCAREALVGSPNDLWWVK